MPKARMGIYSTWHDALHGRAPAASQASEHNGTCQIKTKNIFFHVLFNVEISLEDFPVMWGRNRTMHCGSPGVSQRGVSDTLAFVSSHICPGWCMASGPHPHPCSLVCTLHLDSCPRKQSLTSNCSRGISSYSPMPLTNDFLYLVWPHTENKSFQSGKCPLSQFSPPPGVWWATYLGELCRGVFRVCYLVFSEYKPMDS